MQRGKDGQLDPLVEMRVPCEGKGKGFKNKAGYTAQDAPSTRLKITGDGRTDGRTGGRTDGPTDGHNLL